MPLTTLITYMQLLVHVVNLKQQLKYLRVKIQEYDKVSWDT
jgi:hypothetical protein